MIETQQDPYLALADHALAQPSAPQEDPYLALADKALADEGAGVGDYAKLGVRGLMKSVIEPASGMAALGDTLARKANQLAPGTFTAPPVAQPIKALSQYEPTVNPQAEQSTLGKIIEGGSQALGAIGQTLLAPEASIGHAALAGEMGAQAFGQGQERALAAGATQDQADKAGFLNIGAGLIQALPVGRAAAVLGRAEKLLTATRLGGAVKGAAEFTGAGVAASLWSDAIQKSINSNEDEAAMWKAVKDGLIPQAAIGFVIGGLTQHAAEKSGVKLSEQAKADLLKAGEAVAADQAKSPEATPTPEAAPVEGETPAPKPTRIEVPDEATQGAVDRFKKEMRHKGDVEIHEAPQDARDAVSKIGAKIVEIASPDGKPLPAPGFYDRESGTIVLDKNAEGTDRRSELLLHEITHYAEKEHPELAAEWKKALDEHAPGWAEKTGKETSAERKKLGLPSLSKAGQAEEGRAEGAEGLNLTMKLVRADPESIAKVAQFKPNLFHTLVDTSIRFARLLKLTDRVTVSDQIRGLEKLYKESGSELERKIGPERASKLAFKLRDLHEAMAAETPSEQPRANEKPQPIKLSEPMGGNGEDLAAQPKFNPSDEQLTSRENLKKGMSADDAARALDAIDRRIENALVRGEGPKTPRVKQLARDRALAEKLIYESDPNHPSLAKEDPLSLWARIVKGDEANTEARAKELEKRGIKQTPDVAEAEQRQREAMRVAAERERAFQKMLRESKKQERAAAKEAKKPSKPKFDMAEAEKRGEEHARRLAEAKAKETPKEEKPAPKKKLPVNPRRSVMEQSRVQDPILGAHLEGMASEAGVHQAGGEKMVAPEYRESGVNYARMKRIPKSDWWNDRPARYETYREKETKDIVRRARANEPLTPKEQEYVNWMLDRAEADLYGPNATPEDIQKARDFYLEGSGMRTEPGEDAPFALPKKRLTDAEIEQRIKDEMAAQEKLDIVHAATYRKTLDRVYAEKDNPEKFRGRTPYGERVEAFAKANSSNPVDRERIRFALHTGDPLSGMTDREYGLIRLFVERENSMSQAEREAMPKFKMKPSADVEAYNAERKIQNDWLGAFQKALRAGSSDAEAAKVANEAFPDALRPARFLAGLESPAFALPKKKGEGEINDDRLREFLKTYKMLEGDQTHYAVRTAGKATNDLHAAVESMWQKTERKMAQTERAARELLASKAGKDAVDAFVRGDDHNVPRGEEADYIVAGEQRTSALLRAAKNGTTSAKKAIDYAVDFKMMRSQHGYNLQAVKRPRTPVEKFYEAISNPSARDDLELRTIQKKLAKEKDPEKIASLKARIEEVKVREAARFERGMLALKKAGIDPDDVKSNVGAAAALRVWGHNASTGMDYLLELRATSMVSSPSTSLAALGGNIANVAWNSVLLRLAELPVKGGATPGEIRAILAALPNAMTEASHAFMEVWLRDMPVYELGLQDKGLIEKAEAFENAHLSAIPEKYGGRQIRWLGLTPMTAVDEFARALGTNLEAAGLAHRRSGGDPAKMAEAMADPEIWEEAVKNTRRNIFQEQENNPLVEAGLVMRDAFDRATGALPVKGKKSIPIVPAGRLTLPFVRTGVNGVLEGLRKLPVLAEVPTLSHMYHGEWKNNPELRARDIGRAFVSLAIGVTAWQLANLRDKDGVPFITGSEPHNPAYRSLGQRTAPSHSFRNPFVNDGQWYSYSKMMPFALVLSSMVDMAQRMNPWEVAKNTAGDALDSTFLRTIGGMYDFVTSDAPIDERRDKALRDFATSFVPNAISGAMRAKDDKIHTDALRKDDSGKNTILAGAASRLGFGDTAIRYDSWGRPIEKGGSFITRYASPLPPSGKTDDVHIADRVIQAWNAHVPEGEKPWAPSDPPYSYSSRGVRHYMSQKQFEEFQKRAGEIASSMLDERSLDPQHPTKQQIDRIKKVISRSRIQARREVLRDIPIDEDLE